MAGGSADSGGPPLEYLIHRVGPLVVQQRQDELWECPSRWTATAGPRQNIDLMQRVQHPDRRAPHAVGGIAQSRCYGRVSLFEGERAERENGVRADRNAQVAYGPLGSRRQVLIRGSLEQAVDVVATNQ